MFDKRFEMGLFDKDCWLNTTDPDDLWLEDLYRRSRSEQVELTSVLYNPFAAKGSLLRVSRRPIDGLFSVVHSSDKVAVFLALIKEPAQLTLKMTNYHPLISLGGKVRPGGLFTAIYEVESVVVKSPPQSSGSSPSLRWRYVEGTN